jgi:hypothetical protein
MVHRGGMLSLKVNKHDFISFLVLAYCENSGHFLRRLTLDLSTFMLAPILDNILLR